VVAFVPCIFGFLACIYLVHETTDEALARRFLRPAAGFNCAVIATGGLVFAASLGERESLPATFFRNAWAPGVMGVATLLFVALWFFVTHRRVWLTRVVAAGQVALILLGWWLLYAPNAITTATGTLDFYGQAAPAATLRQLVIALVVGSFFIFPSLVFLLRVFKLKRTES
jgi:cytochrome bd ubiquinol oxidase subunit II